MGEKNKSGQRALRVLLCAAPFMMGLYYERLCALFALALLVWLAVYGRRHGLTLRRNMALTAVAVLFAAYLVTPCGRRITGWRCGESRKYCRCRCWQYA